MTESYDPYANAVAERVNGILKDEFMLEQYQVDMETMKQLIKNSIEIYNSLRQNKCTDRKTSKFAPIKKKTVTRINLQRLNYSNLTNLKSVSLF